MKKLFVLAAIAATVLSCNSGDTDTTTTISDTTSNTATSTTYTPAEGDVKLSGVTMTGWKQMVMLP